MSQKTVIGIFENSDDARRASLELADHGIRRENVDIATRPVGTAHDHVDRDKEHDTAIGRFFHNLFSDDEDRAARYSSVAHRSNSIVTVHCRDEENAEEVADILDKCGAVDVDEHAARYGFYNSNRVEARTDRAHYTSEEVGRDVPPEENRKIPVIREEVRVDKREVNTGGARLRSRIVERPVEETLRLREERVFVERTPANRPATDADFQAFREGTMEIQERAEVPVINKEARVIEEISINKEITERDEKVRDTVRNTEVDVERLEDERRKRDSRNDYDNMSRPL